MNRPTLGDWVKLNLDQTASFETRSVQESGGFWTALAGWQVHGNQPDHLCGGGFALFQRLAIKQCSENFGGKGEFMLVELDWWAVSSQRWAGGGRLIIKFSECLLCCSNVSLLQLKRILFPIVNMVKAQLLFYMALFFFILETLLIYFFDEIFGIWIYSR